LRDVGEACFLEFGQDGVGAGEVDAAGGEVVAAVDGPVAGDFDELDSFAVAGLEADGGAGGDVETVAICFDAIEGELGICFDEVIV
jgi:hypothetical protein